MTVRRAILITVIIAVLGIGAGVGVVQWQPWDDGDGDGATGLTPVPAGSPTLAPETTPSPGGTVLTAEEAAALAGSEMSEKLNSIQEGTPAPGNEVSFTWVVGDCETTGFDEELNAWTVECTETLTLEGAEERSRRATYRLYDATGSVQRISTEGPGEPEEP